MKTKEYAMREMVIDQCLGTGREYTREELMAIVNKELERRDMQPIRSRNTFILDINEMNSKFEKMYGKVGIVFEDRHKKRYYRYREDIESIYNRELTAEEVEKLQEVRKLLLDHKHLPTAKELSRLAVQSFAKKVDLWDRNDAPVTGTRFDHYLHIARMTDEKLTP